ncbi:MFS transporter [Frondihabitans sucicola]|uniref:MFS transporter n=1 Tax=Frondihabitans sucicola TaxID=1268041 RepID=A0ABN6Y1H5_9MICO|nr:MFS transporter [Frondihabitans sucicola]BDZ49725.1 MFS transporter [Frondihabitans sucicola]
MTTATSPVTSTATPPRSVVLLLSIATGAIAANLYYAQSLLDVIGHDLHAPGGAGVLVTGSQIGFALGLILILPAADRFEGRRLLTLLLGIDVLGLVGVAASPSLGIALAAFAVVGAANVAAQLLVPAAANLASDADRGQVVGTVISGLLVGVLVSRTVSGVLGQLIGWRGVFLIAAGLTVVVLLALRRILPPQPGTSTARYGSLLLSGPRLLRQHRTLRLRAVFGGLGFAAFSAFWATVSLHLSGAPFHLGSSLIGLIALLGAAGAIVADLIGRIRHPERSRHTLLAILVTGAAFGLLSAGADSRAAILVGLVILDMGVQGIHVLSQRQIYELDEAARSRINSVYMTFYFVGGAVGSAAATTAWTLDGWTGVCAVGTVIAAAALVLWAVSTPRTGRLQRAESL